MSRSIPVLILIALAALPLVAQSRKFQIDERRGRVIVDGRAVELGERSEFVERNLGLPAAGRDANPWLYPSGVEVRFDDKRIVQSITVRTPFTGESLAKIAVGSVGSTMLAAYREVGACKEGWNQANGIAFELTSVAPPRFGQVTAVRLSKDKAPERPPEPAPTPEKPPAKDPQDNGGRRPNTGRNPTPTPVPTPTNPNPGPTPNTPPDHLVIWDQAWSASRDQRWIEAPTSGWPTDTGRILVRVAYSRNVTSAEMMLGDADRVPFDREDEAYDADLLLRYSRFGRRPSWKWCFVGAGPVHVQIHYFRDKKGIRDYVAANPYATTFAINEPPPPIVKDEPPILVWDQAWRASRELRWVRGPSRGWPRDHGVLLIRARGTPSTSEFCWRAGNGPIQRLPLGDHIVRADVLGDRRDPVGRFFGVETASLYFAYAGYGPVRTQVHWFADERSLRRHCDTEPPAKLIPWFHDDERADEWRHDAGGHWRDRGDFESDWRKPGFQPISGCYNVASPRFGATVRRTSLDPAGTYGNEFDGGLWTSRNERVAVTTSWFFSPMTLRRIDIATAGSDIDAANFIIVELRDINGVWRRVAGFCDENINWCSLTQGRRACSRPMVSIDVGSRVPVVAMRIAMVGFGPFRAGGIAAWGSEAAPPSYEPSPIEPLPAGSIAVPARAGWIDSCGDVVSGEDLFFAIDGTWTIDADDPSGWAWCGPEGYTSYDLRFLLGERNVTQLRRGCPSPDHPPGTLIGRVGLNGPRFLVRPGVPIRAPASGRLYLACNDAWTDDNEGTLVVSIIGGAFPHQDATPGYPVSDDVEIRCKGTVSSEISNRPIGGTDIIVQLEAWPRTVFGGARTDAQGRYDFVIQVPRGAGCVVRLPEFRLESQTRTLNASQSWELDFGVR